MKSISAFFYVFMFYFCVGTFIFNYSKFDFPQQITMWTLIAGIQCLSIICGSNSKEL